MVASPLLLSLMIRNGGELGPVMTSVGKLLACVLMLPSGWFLTWQPQGPSFFHRTLFYFEVIFPLVANFDAPDKNRIITQL